MCIQHIDYYKMLMGIKRTYIASTILVSTTIILELCDRYGIVHNSSYIYLI